MNDDRWLQELAQTCRDRETEERSRLDERWDRLSSGELSAEEEAELRALAASSGEARHAYEAFRPLGADFQASVVRALRKQGFAPAAETAEPPPAKLLPFPLRARFAGWSAAAAAMAAAVLVFFLGPSASFPPYALNVSAISLTRGRQVETREVKVFAPGDRIPVRLQPQTAAAHIWPWDAGCYLVGGDEPRRLETFEKTIFASGAATMKCAISGDLKPGMWTLWAVIGRWGKLPASSDLLTSSAPGQIRDRDWVALGEEIRVQRRDLPP